MVELVIYKGTHLRADYIERSVDIAALSQGDAPTRWVRRVVESVSILDDDMVRRRVEVHIELTDQDFVHPPVVPIALLSRQNGRDISVFDSSGSRLSRLNFDEERRVAHSACVAMLSLALEEEIPHRVNLGASLLNLLSDQVWVLLETIPVPGEPTTPIRTLGNFVIPPAGTSDYWDAFVSAITTYRRSFMLLVDVPCNRRVVVSYDYDDVGFINAQKAGTTDERAAACSIIWGKRGPFAPLKGGRFARPLRALAGSPAVERVLDVPALAYCQSYHLDMFAPRGLHIIGAELGVTTRNHLGNAAALPVVKDADRPLDRAHLSFRPGSNFVERALVKTYVFAPDYGLLNTAVVAGLVSVALLYLTGAFEFGFNPAHWWTISRAWTADTPAALDRSGSTTLLLIVPGLVQILAFRYGESRLVASVFRRTRRVVIFMSAPVVVIAAMIATYRDVPFPARWWSVAICVTFFATCALARQRYSVRQAAHSELSTG